MSSLFLPTSNGVLPSAPGSASEVLFLLGCQISGPPGGAAGPRSVLQTRVRFGRETAQAGEPSQFPRVLSAPALPSSAQLSLAPFWCLRPGGREEGPLMPPESWQSSKGHLHPSSFREERGLHGRGPFCTSGRTDTRGPWLPQRDCGAGTRERGWRHLSSSRAYTPPRGEGGDHLPLASRGSCLAQKRS